MATVTYREIKATRGVRMIRDNLDRITSFGDTLGWSIFLEGAARQRSWGIDITVVDIDGTVLVGDVGQLAGDEPIDDDPRIHEAEMAAENAWLRHAERPDPEAQADLELHDFLFPDGYR